MNIKDITAVILKEGVVSLWSDEGIFTFLLESDALNIDMECVSVTDYENWYPNIWINDKELKYSETERYFIIAAIGGLLDDQKDTNDIWNTSSRYKTEIQSTFNIQL